MKDYTLFNYDYLFGDHFATVSDQAKLLFIKMNFYANAGFVANPKSILDSLGFDRGCLQELLNIEEILMIPNRAECFITAYYAHNPRLDRKAWLNSTYAPYWRGKLWFKENGIATLKEQPKQEVKIIEKVEKSVRSKKPQISEEESNHKSIYIEQPLYTNYDYSKIPTNWTSGAISQGMKLKIRKEQGERLSNDEENYLAAMLDRLNQNKQPAPQPSVNEDLELTNEIVDDDNPF